MNAIVTASGNQVTISGNTSANATVEAFFHGPVDRDITGQADAGGHASGTTTLPDGTYDITISFPGGTQFATVTLPANPPITIQPPGSTAAVQHAPHHGH